MSVDVPDDPSNDTTVDIFLCPWIFRVTLRSAIVTREIPFILVSCTRVKFKPARENKEFSYLAAITRY